VALISVPLSIVVTRLIAKRSQPLFVAQWGQTGRLNAHIEETYTGHALVRVFGHQSEAEEVFQERNEELYKASYGAQFLSGIILPAIMFIGNLNYVFIAVIGGLRVASGSMSLGDVQAFIQYSRQFSQPLTQVASMSNLLQSGVASAERVFELLDAAEQVPDPAEPERLSQPPRARVLRARLLPLRPRRAVDRRPFAGGGSGAVGGDRRADRCGKDDAGQPDHAVLRARQRAHHL
jgi:ATP-binding cassette subfamily B protein